MEARGDRFSVSDTAEYASYLIFQTAREHECIKGVRDTLLTHMHCAEKRRSPRLETHRRPVLPWNSHKAPRKREKPFAPSTLSWAALLPALK